MAGAIRMMSLARGVDPRDFALFAFGGGGPLHAASLARELAIPRVLSPARPGLTNALGRLVADLRHDFVATVSQPLEAQSDASGGARVKNPQTDGRSGSATAHVDAGRSPRSLTLARAETR